MVRSRARADVQQPQEERTVEAAPVAAAPTAAAATPAAPTVSLSDATKRTGLTSICHANHGDGRGNGGCCAARDRWRARARPARAGLQRLVSRS